MRGTHLIRVGVLVLLSVSSGSLISHELKAKVDSREAAVRLLADEVEGMWDDRCAAERCNETFGSRPQCAGRGDGQTISTTHSVARISEDASESNPFVREDVCYTRGLDSAFQATEKLSTALRWRYFGTPNGVQRSYPGRPWTTDGRSCNPFDPRKRPWFVAASSGPKDVMLVLDRSASMQTRDENGRRRIELLRSAAIDVLSTLTSADYVGVVSFCATVKMYSDTLVPATAENLRLLKHWVNRIEPSGNAIFTTGLRRAFSILRTSQQRGVTSGCTTAMLFLTDGTPQDRGDDIVDMVRENVDDHTVLFTYSLSSSATVDIPKRMACAGNGVWSRITHTSNLRAQMVQYYSFIAAGMEREDVVWTEPYEDAGGLGQVITAAKAVYDRSGRVPVLLGVVGADLVLSETANVTDAYLSFLRDRSSQCVPFNATRCQMQFLRQESFFHPRSSLAPSSGDEAEQETSAICSETEGYPALDECDEGERISRAVCSEPISAESVFCPGLPLNGGKFRRLVCCEQPLRAREIFAIAASSVIFACGLGVIGFCVISKRWSRRKHLPVVSRASLSSTSRFHGPNMRPDSGDVTDTATDGKAIPTA